MHLVPWLIHHASFHILLAWGQARSFNKDQRWRAVPSFTIHNTISTRQGEMQRVRVCLFYINVERLERFCRRREQVRKVKDKIREPKEVWREEWGVEWLPGWRSGLRPLMSIPPFGAYCRVRGLDFYGDGFHLLESSFSLSFSLSLSLSLTSSTCSTSRSDFFFFFPSCDSTCDFSADWISQAFSSPLLSSPLLSSPLLSSPLPAFSISLWWCLFGHIRIDMIPCDIFQMPICLSHLRDYSICCKSFSVFFFFSFLCVCFVSVPGSQSEVTERL